ncbi:hypothetical protein ACOJUR_15475 [Alicyclobacillus tolerans]|uniref:Uncharacterized protein n=1 Tax=Alicyclobacillus tolerans TaxID=90970 RepID=A0ABT9LYH3_9BACL|nr:hypothetical protein [Alicyclobacillus tengchongensis]MDP9729317.1 hypothetical protein [Alicyclobacillus tengchongensis]
MPIKGRSDIYRVPRVGKIHLGVKKVSDKSGHEYPSAVDYFVVKADDTTSEAAAQAFQSVYGDKPREITICFPSDDPDQFFPQWLSSYRSVGGRYELFCRGDGEVAYRVDGQGGRVQMPCAYQDCPLYQEKKCKELGQLQFFLPEVPGIGCWQLDTTSYHTTVNLNSSIQMLRALTGGAIKMIPLKLRVIPKVVSPEGKPKTVFVLQLGIDDLKLTDFLKQKPLIGAAPVVEPIPEDELPEDLFLADQVVGGEKAEPTLLVVADKRLKQDQEGLTWLFLRAADREGQLMKLATSDPAHIQMASEIGVGRIIYVHAKQKADTWPDVYFIDQLHLDQNASVAS